MSGIHDPRLVRRHDDRWEVRCRECQSGETELIPLGIGMPLVGEREARRIVENHADDAILLFARR